MSGLLTGLCFVAAAGCVVMLVFIAYDVTGRDRGAAMAAYLGLAPIALLPAWVALLLGAVSGRWWCAGLAVIPCAAQLAAVRRDRPARRPDEDKRPGATILRLATANVFFGNADAGLVWPVLSPEQPDIVALQEISAVSGSWLLPQGWSGHIETRADAFGSALLAGPGSRLEDARTVALDGLPQIRAEVVLDGVRVAVWCVHPKAPTGATEDRVWRRQLGSLAALLAAEPGPVVVAGDFNATGAHRPFRRLLSVGRVEDIRLPGHTGTWPARWSRHPPCPPRVMTLDHVLVRGLRVHSLRRLDAAASDHHPLLVELSLSTSPEQP